MAEAHEASGSDDQWTCGMGLAAHARVPARMAEFLKSLAENLQAHMPTIDTSDPNGEAEWAAYGRLSKEHDALCSPWG